MNDPLKTVIQPFAIAKEVIYRLVIRGFAARQPHQRIHVQSRLPLVATSQQRPLLLPLPLVWRGKDIQG